MTTGSLVNLIYTEATPKIPTVGMGATMCGWTDRHAATIIKVTPKSVTVQRDNATRVDPNGMSETQGYTYTRNPQGETEVYRLNKKGQYRGTGGHGGVIFGIREEYYDFSF